MNFNDALKNNNISNFEMADTHNHCNYSASKDYLRKHNVDVDILNVKDIHSLIDFFEKTMQPLEYKKDTLKMLINGNISNAINTSVVKLHTSLNYRICMYAFNSDVTAFIDFLKQFNSPNIEIKWILDISRNHYEESHEKIITKIMKTKFFKGIDLAGTELAQPNSVFIKYFKLAEKLNIDKYVHTGEQLDAYYIRECIEDFDPKYIQHGVSIISDNSIIELAKSKNIIFNVCPTSNVMLGYVSSIKNHPIKQMVENGLLCTIGTDDMTVFDSNIINEYQILYNEKVLTAEQLEIVRNNSLKY